MAVKCPNNCGKKFVDRQHAESHADSEHEGWREPKCKGWATPYGFIDFAAPVTYAEALAAIKPMHDEMQKRFAERNSPDETPTPLAR